MVGPRPKRENLVKRPREVVARVCINSLEQSEDDPDVDRDDVQVSSGKYAVSERATDRAHSEN